MLTTLHSGVLSWFYFSGTWSEAKELIPIELNYFYVPIIVVILGVWLICSAFFTVYDMAVDTTFLCFCKIFMYFFELQNWGDRARTRNPRHRDG
jgi:hypothetical protein